jgi:hypothetical protein
MLDTSRPGFRDRPLKRDVSRQACDACRTRKARCDTQGAQDLSLATNYSPSPDETIQTQACSRCVRLGLECTYRMPFGIRGPRRKTLSSASVPSSTVPPESLSASSNSFSAVSSRVSTHNATSPGSQLYLVQSEPGRIPNDSQQWQESPNALSSHRSPTASFARPTLGEDLCSRDLLKRMLLDYLEFLYPLIPVVHRPSFHRDLYADRDLYNEDFSGFILGLCAVTVGTMPNRFKEYTTCATPLAFRTRTEMIRYCYGRLHDLRRYDYFENVSFHKWAASYLMGIALFQVGEHNQARMIEVESMQLARMLGLHQISEYMGLNCIEAQLRKKAFWLMFYGYVHYQYQNLRKERLTFLDPVILASIDLAQLMPLEVDDEYILEHTVLSQPTGVLSVVAGFNAASRVFWTALRSPAEKAEDCYCEPSRSSIAQFHHLKARLLDLHYVLDNLPPQLRQWQNASDDVSLYGAAPEQHRILKAQFATTRANVHVTHLWLQSIISDQVDAILVDTATRDNLGPSVPDHRTRWVEREHLCRQLLHVLYSIPDVYIEPNGNHLVRSPVSPLPAK